MQTTWYGFQKSTSDLNTPFEMHTSQAALDMQTGMVHSQVLLGTPVGISSSCSSSSCGGAGSSSRGSSGSIIIIFILVCHAADGHIVHRRCSLSLALLAVLFITTLFLPRRLVPRYSGCPSPQSSGTGDFQQVEQDL